MLISKPDMPLTKLVNLLGLQVNRSRKPKKSVANLTKVVKNYPGLGEYLAFDEFRQKIVKRTGSILGEGYWTDVDSTAIKVFVSEYFDLEPSDSQVYGVVELIADENKYHPVQEYLKSLVWDGKPRVDGWLERYFGCDSNNAIHQFEKTIILGSVARIMRSGCKFDNVLIIEGKQGIGKSTGLRTLYGKDWFTDAPIMFGNVNAYLTIAGSWCIEIAELNRFVGAEATMLNAFFSQRKDEYRRPYGRNLVEVPRHCVFIGTTNDTHYLSGSTGNRRYMPVRAHQVDVQALAEDRDMIWAEALARFLNEEKYWFEPNDADIVEAQEARFEHDPWEDAIAEHLKSLIDSKVHTDSLYTVLGLELGRVKRLDNQRIRDIMHRLGWEPCRPYILGSQKRGFQKV